jgi:hypothetical protein
MTTYVLAGSKTLAIHEAHAKKLRRPADARTQIYEWFIYVGPQTYALEGRNILKGDKVLFGAGTTAKMIDTFMMYANSRGTRLSDLEIIHDRT